MRTSIVICISRSYKVEGIYRCNVSFFRALTLFPHDVSPMTIIAVSAKKLYMLNL
jgi:hypothetical protein